MHWFGCTFFTIHHYYFISIQLIHHITLELYFSIIFFLFLKTQRNWVNLKWLDSSYTYMDHPQIASPYQILKKIGWQYLSTLLINLLLEDDMSGRVSTAFCNAHIDVVKLLCGSGGLKIQRLGEISLYHEYGYLMQRPALGY